MSECFKAAIIDEFDRPVDIRETMLPEPGGFHALIRNLSSGVCHTDVHAAQGDWPIEPDLPLIPGHEGVEEVIKLGPGGHTVAVGDIVGNDWRWSACGTCEYCRTGRETFCNFAEYGGYPVDGSFGEYMLVDTRYCARIPEGSDPSKWPPSFVSGLRFIKG